MTNLQNNGNNKKYTIYNYRNILYYEKKRRYVWFNILLSFIFYLIVVLGTTKVPTLGVFMMFKTVCYILIILAFAKMINKSEE